MLLRILQRLVRAAPGPARAIWGLVPEGVRRAVSPLVHPIAAGARTRGRLLPVPDDGPVARFDVVLERDAELAEAVRRELGSRGHRVLSAPPGRPLADFTAELGVVDALHVTTPSTSEVRRAEGRLLGFRPLDVGALRAVVDADTAFPEVSIVVVTHSSREACRACLAGIRRNTGFPGLEVLVVDNGSRDGTSRVLEEAARRDPRIRVLTSAENLGYAPACNWGLREARGTIAVLLNDDTVVAPGWLSRLVAHLLADERLGLVCPVTNEIGGDARVDAAYETLEGMEAFARARAARFLGERRPTETVALFCALARLETLRSVGFLDERYEIGMFEDDDLSLTLKRRGLGLAVALDAFVHHVGQASFGQLEDAEYLRIWEANRKRFEEKWGHAWRPPRGGSR